MADLKDLNDIVNSTAIADAEERTRKTTTFTSLPQELVDAIIQPLLPSTLTVKSSGDSKPNDLTTWKWVFELRRTTRKIRTTVDDRLKGIKKNDEPVKISSTETLPSTRASPTATTGNPSSLASASPKS